MASSGTLTPPKRSKSGSKGSGKAPGRQAGGGSAPRKPKSRAPVTAETLAAKQRDISVSEFFAKNRHLLGFDNARKALLTTVKEAVDNSLDACEEAGILPDIYVELRHLPDIAEDRFIVIVQDNGPGIVRRQVENIFGRLLYGSKFHRLKMSRGQQGIGISAAGMYGLITTGKPVMIISKTSKKKPAHEVVLKMDTSKNKADVVSDTEHPEDDELFPHGTGTRVEIEMQGKYFKGSRSVDEYVELTAIANPHARFEYASPPTSAMPKGERRVYERSVSELPPTPEEIKPHPHGIELGTLIGMVERTDQRQLGGFFSNEFCRIGPKVAKQIASSAGLTPHSWIKSIDHAAAEKIYKALQETRFMAPPTNCLAPIGVGTILKGLQRGLDPDFITASSRPPAVYRGRPFIIEAGIAFGGNMPADEPAQVFRYANRVPLQYQQSACASFKAALETNWKNYGMQQPRGSLPVGPLVIMVHMASVWVPFTSESKEAIAEYDDIRAEMLLALKDCGRKLKTYLNKRAQIKRAGERRLVFQRYIGEISKACHELTGTDQEPLYNALLRTAQRKTAEMDKTLTQDGKLVDGKDKLERDESVFIKDVVAPESEPDRPRSGAGSPDPTGETLFGDDEPKPTTTKRKTKKKAKKKVRKKR